MTTLVMASPKFRSTLRKSAAVSPTVVASTLITQKMMVTSGTLFSMGRIDRAVVARGEVME